MPTDPDYEDNASTGYQLTYTDGDIRILALGGEGTHPLTLQPHTSPEGV
jgi:hypothetical protein